MNLRVLHVFFRFYIEWTFISLIFVIFHLLSSQQFPLTASMGISAAGSIVFAISLNKKPHLGKPLFFLIIFPLIVFIGNVSGLELFYGTIMALFIFWRILKFHEDTTSHSESLWLAVTFLIGVFISPLAYFYGGKYLIQIGCLLIFQLLFILWGQFLLKWLDFETASKRRFVISYSKLFGWTLVLVAVFTVGRDLLKELFFLVLQTIGWVLSLMLYPFFSWITSRSIQERAAEVFSHQNPNAEYDSSIESAKPVFNPEFWGPILFAIITGITFYLIFKKSSLFKKEQISGNVQPGFITSAQLNDPAHGNQLLNRRSVAPVNQIRKEIFLLEKFAHKKGLGRLNHESIKEWFNRLGIKSESRTVHTYEKVRYGEYEEQHIAGWFKDDIRRIKKQFITLEKSRKEEQKQGLKGTLKKVLKRN
ncbi:hypothetical protein [Mesobacillus jeotgali]|uniref:hypothetical protein n=1 Tax=Mesobacillus jeotgali TaxID=129985 RepID=UPI0009A6AD8A|nr:hypothetical protein [Mesobacillus jeotgali]